LRDFEKYRSEFPITEKYVYLNHAAVSPPPIRVGKAVEALFEEYIRCGIECYPEWMKRISEVRLSFAALIHARPDEIAFVGNTSEGLGAIAAGIKWKKGDVALVPTPEFPANVYPWMNLERHGVRVDFIQRKDGRFGVKDVEKALSPGARLLSVSSVDFLTGFHCDLKALGDFCNKKGLLFCVDAIQSLGVVPMDVKKYGIHFLCSGSHKWLLSAMGCGGLFISRDVDNIIHPDRVGWKSVVREEDFFRLNFDLKPDALRFEPGAMNIAGIYSLGASIDLLMEVGIEKIHQHVIALNDLFIMGLKERHTRVISPMDEAGRSGILSFVPSSDPGTLSKFLTEKKVMVSLRDNVIRLSPHFYNNRMDVNHFFKVLDSFYP